VETLRQDVRYGLRVLARSPGFTVVAVLILAAGIGANTAVFSFLDRVLLRSLPVRAPHELVKVEFRSQDGGTDDSFSYPLYASYRDESQVFSGLVAYWGDGANLRISGSVEPVMAMAVSGNYFSALGVRPALGRAFLDEEGRMGNACPVTVISHGLWQQRFGGDPAVIGKTINLDDRPLTIVGVAPREFTGTLVGVGCAVYVPLGTWASLKGFPLDSRDHTWLSLLGRLKPGVHPAQAQANLRVLTEQISRVDRNAHPEVFLTDGSHGSNLWLHEGWWWPVALVQMTMVLVLLVACANVANMLLARGMTRQREIAIRRALGANRRRIVRQLLVESLLLAVLSGACGVLLAHWLSRGLRSMLTVARVLNTPVGVDGRILVFGLLGSLSSVLLFGLAPALEVSRPNVMSTLKDGSAIVTMLARRWNLRNLLVVWQIAFSVIVLALGTLCARSLGKLRVADPGFDADRVLGVSVDFERGPARGLDARRFFADLTTRVAAFPGVQRVGLAAHMPLSTRGHNRTGIRHIDDFPMPPEQEPVSMDFGQVSPGYFQTLGVPLLRGRDFSVLDGPEAPRVMIVNEVFARRYWPDRDPIGKHVTLHNEVREVVGVVQAARLYSLREAPVPMVFWPLAQPMENPFMRNIKPVLLVRISDHPEAAISLVRKELESAGLGPAVCEVRTLAERAWDLVSGQRMMAKLLNGVGLLGLLFVGAGIFTVMAYEVGRRTREIGIRMALGAQRRNVLRWVLRQGAGLTGIGLGLGIGLSFAPMWVLSRLLPKIRTWDAYFLYGVHVWDPLTYAGVVLVIVLISLAACWLPARRAAKIDPLAALRYE
jgi:predicted permease